MEQILARWKLEEAEREANKPPVTYREPGDLTFPLGTELRVTAVAPNWNYACAGYPVIGSVGTVVSDPRIPTGRTCVQFTGTPDEPGVLHLTDGNKYTGLDERHSLMFIPDNCLEST